MPGWGGALIPPPSPTEALKEYRWLKDIPGSKCAELGRSLPRPQTWCLAQVNCSPSASICLDIWPQISLPQKPSSQRHPEVPPSPHTWYSPAATSSGLASATQPQKGTEPSPTRGSMGLLGTQAPSKRTGQQDDRPEGASTCKVRASVT
jgi:hypothetical protein